MTQGVDDQDGQSTGKESDLPRIHDLSLDLVLEPAPVTADEEVAAFAYQGRVPADNRDTEVVDAKVAVRLFVGERMCEYLECSPRTNPQVWVSHGDQGPVWVCRKITDTTVHRRLVGAMMMAAVVAPVVSVIFGWGLWLWLAGVWGVGMVWVLVLQGVLLSLASRGLLRVAQGLPAQRWSTVSYTRWVLMPGSTWDVVLDTASQQLAQQVGNREVCAGIDRAILGK